ncbi:alcohol dehydrogenase catalytic domain-containing protein [Nonomuraea rubra]|uniref:alcohol dehydrogenase catalytic domain-containing protein n=1 Tax=Nonomuraea rubra TaxID=46180 RepID=UPI0031EDE39F
MGHEYVGVVEQVGDQVKTIKAGDFVVGSFSPPTTPARSARRLPVPLRARRLIGAIGTQAQYARIPLADGTLVATPPARGRRPRPEPADRLRRAGHRLVRRGPPPKPAQARPWPWWATARSGCSASWPPGSSAPNASSSSAATPTGRNSPPSSAPPTSSPTRGDQGVTQLKELTGGLGAHSVIEAVRHPGSR